MARDPENAPLQDPSALDADPEFTHSLDVRNQVRSRLEADVEAFLSRGGAIQRIDDAVRADPPRRPESRYGRRSI